MAEIQSAESSGKRQQKTLSHIEIHPKLGGGHTVRHVYRGYSAEPKDHSFGPNEGSKFAAHLAKHTGVPLKFSHGGDASETEATIQTGEM